MRACSSSKLSSSSLLQFCDKFIGLRYYEFNPTLPLGIRTLQRVKRFLASNNSLSSDNNDPKEVEVQGVLVTLSNGQKFLIHKVFIKLFVLFILKTVCLYTLVLSAQHLFSALLCREQTTVGDTGTQRLRRSVKIWVKNGAMWVTRSWRDTTIDCS